MNQNIEDLRRKLNSLYELAMKANNLEVASQTLSTLLALEMSVK